MAIDTEVKPAPPYLPFRMVLNLLHRLEADKAVPPRIDRGFLTGAEGAKTQLMLALKYLGLLGPAGEVTGQLNELVTKPTDRPRMIADLWQRYYAEPMRLSALNATQGQLEEAFAPLTGDTRRKAAGFFLHGAEYAKLKLSPFFNAPRMRAGATTQRRRKKTGGVEPRGDEALSAAVTTVDPKQRYLDLLLKKVELEDKPDPQLLDRIEILLGYRSETS